MIPKLNLLAAAALVFAWSCLRKISTNPEHMIQNEITEGWSFSQAGRWYC